MEVCLSYDTVTASALFIIIADKEYSSALYLIFI